MKPEESADAQSALSLRFRALLIGLGSVLLYLPALKNDFINWDDDYSIYENPHLKAPGIDFIRWSFKTFYYHNWQPLTWFSLSIDYTIWGLNPFGYHLTNILLHGLNVFVVALFAGKVLKAAMPGNNDRKILLFASLTGVFFAAHPLHVESVVWVSERKDLLCALFFMLSLHLYMNYAGTGKKAFYILCLVSFSLSLMSKPMAVTLPLVLLIMDFYPLGRLSKGKLMRVAVYEKLPFFVLSIAESVVTMMAQKAAGAISTIETFSISKRLVLAVKALGFYVSKIILPVNLLPYYHIPDKITFLMPGFLLSLSFIIFIALVSIRLRKRAPCFAASWAYYAVTILPTLGLIRAGSHAAADRYMYLPILGPLLLLSGITIIVPKKVNYLLISLSVVIAIVLSLLTLKQMSIWKDSLSFWGYNIKKSGINDLNSVGMGMALFNEGMYEKAIGYFDKAIEFDPSRQETYYSRGYSHHRLGRLKEAIGDYSKAIEIDIKKPNLLKNLRADYYINRGVAYAESKNYKKSLEDFDKALALSPQTGFIYFNRAFVYEKLGENKKAAGDYMTAARMGYKPAEKLLNSKGLRW